MRTSAFEILGPVMVGPSSSHTAGALRIALVARQLACAPIRSARFTLLGSFARTAKGHGTDKALVAGILGMAADDVRIRDSFERARTAGLSFSFDLDATTQVSHPNTVVIDLDLSNGTSLQVTGESVGGGRVRVTAIDGVAVEITGELETLFVSHLDHPGILAALTGTLSGAGINIATMHTYRTAPGAMAYSVFEVDTHLEPDLVRWIAQTDQVAGASVVRIPGALPATRPSQSAHDFDTAASLLSLCEKDHRSIGDVMRLREDELTGDAEKASGMMGRVLSVMREAASATLTHPTRSLGGLLCGQAAMVGSATGEQRHALMGGTLTKATAYAMATLERSASMGVIVAAPTAGSAGVVPGALLASGSATQATEAQIGDALWCAAAIGALASSLATVSGAEGGCQAEVGTASAMAAAGLAQLLGGSPKTCLHAASIALGDLLGLVCDPVGGLVEYPCQDRNALGVACAMSSAQLALAGVTSPLPFDEVLHAMRAVGASLSPALRETALGGLAAEPSAARCMGCAGR